MRKKGDSLIYSTAGTWQCVDQWHTSLSPWKRSSWHWWSSTFWISSLFGHWDSCARWMETNVSQGTLWRVTLEWLLVSVIHFRKHAKFLNLFMKANNVHRQEISESWSVGMVPKFPRQISESQCKWSQKHDLLEDNSHMDFYPLKIFDKFNISVSFFLQTKQTGTKLYVWAQTIDQQGRSWTEGHLMVDIDSFLSVTQTLYELQCSHTHSIDKKAVFKYKETHVFPRQICHMMLTFMMHCKFSLWNVLKRYLGYLLILFHFFHFFHLQVKCTQWWWRVTSTSCHAVILCFCMGR